MTQDSIPPVQKPRMAPIASADDLRDQIAEAEAQGKWALAGYLKSELLKAIRKS
jgi:hypothetical protein